MHDSYVEISRQGEALGKALALVREQQEPLKAFFAEPDYDEVVFVACGSSYWSSLSACMTLQEQLHIPCSAVKSGDIVLNRAHYEQRYSKPLVIAPSRSGQTSETLIALEMFKQRYHSRVLSLVEYDGAKILEYSDMALAFPWANERSVCQTRSFSTLYLGMVAIAAVVGGDSGLLESLAEYVERCDALAGQADKQARHMLADFPAWRSLVALGSGKQYGVVIEGAYIAIEMAALPAHYFGTLEWRHGPIVLSNAEHLVCLTSAGKEARVHEEKLAKDTRATGARVLAILDDGRFDEADYRLSLGFAARPETVALYAVMAMQFIAYHQSVARGLDPDHPGELNCWIAL